MSVRLERRPVSGVLTDRPTATTRAAAHARTRAFDRTDAFVVVATILASAALLALGRGLTFFADEWAVIDERPIGLDSFLTPFNEHWLGVQLTIFRAMVEVFGLGSYVPFLALLVGLHALVALEVYVLARRASHPAVAAAVTLIVLLFGSGFENLFWAMQVGFIGAIALGLGAFLLLDRRPGRGRVVLATLLLTLAMMTSGFGLFVLALVGLDLLFDRTRRRLVLATFVPAGVWLTWYLTLGRAGVVAHGDPFSAEALANVPSFVGQGVASAFGAALGGGAAGGLIAIALAIGAVALAWGTRRGPIRIARRAFVYAAAIVAMYALLGLVRAELGVDGALLSRYTYLSGILAALAVASLIGRRRLPARPRLRLATVGAGVFLLVLSLAWNVTLLISGRALYADRADMTRALVDLALTDPLPDGVAADRWLILIPSPDRLRAIVARYGDPRSDPLAADAIRPIPDATRAEALRRAQDPPDWLLAGCGGSRPQPAMCQQFDPTQG